MALINKYKNFVRSKAKTYFLIGADKEDIVQEGMIGLYHAIMDYKKSKTGRSFKNFAYLCVWRKIIDAVKLYASKKNAPLNSFVSMESEEEWMAAGLSPEEILILSDDRRELKQKMSRVLSDFEFKITTMYMDGMTCAEICDATGKSAKSIENAIQRSKRKLQNYYQNSNA